MCSQCRDRDAEDPTAVWSILGSTLAAFCCFPGQKTKSFQSPNMVFLCKQHSHLQSILKLLTEVSQVISQQIMS